MTEFKSCKSGVVKAILVGGVILFVSLSSASEMAEEGVEKNDALAVQWVIDHQIKAFKSGDHHWAYTFAAPNVKKAFPTVEMFIDMVREGYKPLYRPSSYFFGRSMYLDGEIYQELIVSDSTRQLWQVIYTLRQQFDNSWKVTNVMMYPYRGTAA